MIDVLLRMAIAGALCAWFGHVRVAAAPGVFDVRDYGAVGDGKTLDTRAVNQAIEACSAAGSGQVRLPPGKYLTGTVHLKSNVTLNLEAGSRLVGTSDVDRYQQFTPPEGTFEARLGRWHRALVLGEGVENVTITGRGGIVTTTCTWVCVPPISCTNAPGVLMTLCLTWR